MDESIQEHLKISTKLSGAMRIGCGLLRPSRQGEYCYFNERCGACALGAALFVLTGERDANETKGVEKLSKLTGVPEDTLDSASELFESGRMTREQVADWLEGQGY